MAARLDTAQLYRELDDRRRALGLHWNEAADAMNIPRGRIYRLTGTRKVSADLLIAALAWLGYNAISHLLVTTDQGVTQ